MSFSILRHIEPKVCKIIGKTPDLQNSIQKTLKRHRKDINFRWLFLVFLGFWAQKPKNTRKSHWKLMSFQCLFGLNFEDKGYISKQNCWAITFPKKTNERICFSILTEILETWIWISLFHVNSGYISFHLCKSRSNF